MFRHPPLAVLALAAAACAPAEKAPSADTGATAAPTVTGAPGVDILAPADGDSVSLPVVIRLGASGVEVVPATGKAEPGKGHHHLVVDGDSPADTIPLPKPPVVYHLGNGATEFSLDSLSKGPHRVIAIFASGDHVPMAGVRRDTVTFIVR